MRVDLRPQLSQLRTAGKFFTIGMPVICAAYLGLVIALHDLRPEHLLAVALALVLSLWSDGSRKLARVGLPYLLYAMVYDSMRWYEDAIRSPVIHVREPYEFDLRFFGIHGLTPNEWLQKHTYAVLDFFTGLAYTPFFFIGESIILSIYLAFSGRMRVAERFTWAFVIANFVGFSIYYIYPAAPPWYVAQHGFVVDMSVHASPAGTIRFDHLIGFPLMQSFYGKSADVFGAIPSLHIVYPFLAMVFGWRLRRFRPWAIGYFLLVCFSAVYLDHHYVLDILAGLADAALVMGMARAFFGALYPESESTLAMAEEPLRT